MTIGEIVDLVARDNCWRVHEGAEPCPTCSILRMVAKKAILTFLQDSLHRVARNLESLDA